jgi:formyl-CoA transferase
MPALDGLRILDLTQYEAGTACTQALAWLGADVVKVERLDGGDPGRGITGDFDFEDSEYFLNWNSNKRSVTLALDQPEGRDLLLALVPEFDVFIENFGPGVAEKLALDYDVIRQIKPDVIYASIRGFGDSGPYSSYKCFDMVAQAAAGAFSVTGDPEGPPMRPGTTTGDSGSGVQMALAITAAWVQHQREGVGQRIELSMQEAMTYFMRTTIAMGTRWGTQAAKRTGAGFGALINLYPCKPFGPNDYVYIMAVTPRMFGDVCRAIERPELLQDERFVSPRKRSENADALRGEIGAWTTQYDKHEAMRKLCEAGVPASAVFDTLDLFQNEHLLARDFVKTVQHEVAGDAKLLGWPARMSESAVEITAAPVLGRHTAEVLSSALGLDEPSIAELRSRGIVGPEPVLNVSPESPPSTNEE